MDISNDQARLQIDVIHRFLSSQSTWAIGIPREVVERSIVNSLCFGGYENNQQIAFARVVSDYASFAYLMDVFVLPEHRGRGLSLQLMRTVIAHPQLQGLRRFMLASSNARGLYQHFGFRQLANPDIMMEINVPDIYTKT
nr:GNAT family N-acetyltransferase [uncultured Undibacterium sp.]